MTVKLDSFLLPPSREVYARAASKEKVRDNQDSEIGRVLFSCTLLVACLWIKPVEVYHTSPQDLVTSSDIISCMLKVLSRLLGSLRKESYLATSASFIKR
jgi:hypothetical protein